MTEIFGVALLLLRWLHFIGGFIWLSTIFLLTFNWDWVMLTLNNGKNFIKKVGRIALVSSSIAILTGVSLAILKSGLRGEVFLGLWGISILAGGFLAMVMLAIQFSFIFPYLEG